MIETIRESLKVGYIQNKIWGPGSVYVPDKKPNINYFHGFNDLFYGNPDNESLFTCDYWDKKLINGRIRLPGEWNYCFIDGLGFHMVQLDGAGVWELTKPDKTSEEIEFFNYQLIYDDWVNDFLENKVDVSGTVIITGDKEKVWHNYLRTVPIIQDLNGIEEYNAVKKEVGKGVNIIQASENFKDQNGFRWFDPRAIKYFQDQLSGGYERIEPNRNSFLSPFLINESWLGNWKYSLLCGLMQYLYPTDNLTIYDVKPQNIQAEQFKARFRQLFGNNIDPRIYSISKDSIAHVTNIGGQKANNVYLSNLDFSGLKDIVELNAQSFTELAPSDLTWRKWIEKVNKKASTNLSIYETFEDIVDVFHRYGGPIFTNNIQDWQGNIDSIRESQLNGLGLYKNLEIVDLGYKSTEWKKDGQNYESQWTDTIKPGDYLSKNFYQLNHVLYRNTGIASGSIFLGDKTTISYKIGDKKQNLRNWICDLKQNNQNDDETLKKLKNDQKIFTYSRQNLEVSELNWEHRLQLIKHLDRVKLIDGKTKKELHPTKGLMVLPDYQNNGWVLANYSTEEVKEGYKKEGGKNKIFHAREVLALTSKATKTNIERPTEDLRLGNQYKAGNLSVRLGIIVRKLVESFFWIKEIHKERITFVDDVADLPSYTMPIQIWKTWHKPVQGGYWYEYDGNYSFAYHIPDLKSEKYNWHISFPYESDAKINEILEKYHGLNFLKYKTPRDEKKFDENDKEDNPICSVFDKENSYNYTKEVNYKDLPDEVKRKTAFLWVKLTRNTDEETKNKIKELCLELWETFFKKAWTNGLHYDACAFVGGVKGWERRNIQTNKEDYWKEEGFTNMTHLRPYKGQWFISSLKMGMIQGTIINKNDYFGGKQKLSISWQVKRWDTVKIHWIENAPDSHSSLIVFWIHPVNSTNNVLNSTRLTYPFNETSHLAPEIITNHNNLGAVYFRLFGGVYSYKVDDSYPLHDAQANYSLDNIKIDDYNNFIYDTAYTNAKSSWTLALNQQSRVWNATPAVVKVLNKEFTTISHLALNPTRINWADFYLNDVYKRSKLEELADQPLPHYLANLLNPDNVASVTHNHLNDLGNDPLETLKARLKTWITEIHKRLYSNGFYIDLKGTHFISFVRYLAGNWIFELIPKNNSVFGNEKKQLITFKNEKTYTTDNLEEVINSTTEINIYGQKIPIKDRIKLDGNNIDLNLSISQINDPYQSASEWYHIEIDSEQATFRQEIEVPKEQAISSNISIAERQNLLKNVELNHADRFYERTQYEIEKKRGLQSLLYKDWESGMDFMTGLGQTFSGAYTGLANLTQQGKGGLLKGLGYFNIASGAISGIGKLIINLQKNDLERAATVENYAIQNLALTRKHERAAEMDKMSLYNMASNNNNAQFNNSLIYKELNKLRNKTDVFLTIYKPKGWLLQKIKEHYKEYGYEIWLTDEHCRGIQDIKEHLKYEVIKYSNHDNPNIKEMIENRLLTGIKVIPLND